MKNVRGATKRCGVDDARKRLADARQFLEAAEILDSPDVVATNAVHAAIAAADAITCHALGERSKGAHQLAVRLLAKVDNELSTALKRALAIKTKAAYESSDVSDSDAKACMRRAQSLVAAAGERVAF